MQIHILLKTARNRFKPSNFFYLRAALLPSLSIVIVSCLAGITHFASLPCIATQIIGRFVNSRQLLYFCFKTKD